jgi:hypothetical protein
MHRYGKAVLAVGLSALALGAQAVAPIVTYGDFESLVPSWQTLADTVSFSGGLASMQFNTYQTGTEAGAIEQVITFASGTDYLLTFMAGGSGRGKVDLINLNFDLNDGTRTSPDPFEFGAGEHNYTFHTGSIADAYSHLRFTSVEGTITLDGISITAAVPEPEAWTTLLAGLAIVSGLKRRRYKVPA